MNDPDCCFGSPFSARCVLMRTNDGSIEEHALIIELDLKMLENALPVPPPRPKRESVVDSFPRTEALGQISPRNARLESVQHRLDEEALAKFRCRPATTWKYAGQKFPLRIGQSMAVCHSQL